MHFYEFNFLNHCTNYYLFFVDDLIPYTSLPYIHLLGTEFNNNNNFALISLMSERCGQRANRRIGDTPYKTCANKIKRTDHRNESPFTMNAHGGCTYGWGPCALMQRLLFLK